MLAKVTSFATIGLDGAAIQVEVDISRGMPSFIIVGLPDMAVQESKEWVRAAIKNSGGSFPDQRITVNLAELVSHLQGLNPIPHTSPNSTMPCWTNRATATIFAM